MQNILPKSLRHVVIAGMVIFLLYFVVGNEARRPSRNIVISVQQQASLSSEFERTWQRPPTDVELNELLGVFIRRELAYREASRLALGRDDAGIRRRLQQKLEMLAADDAALETPTRDELQIYLNEHADKFRVDPLLTFRQIYFDNTNNAIGADASARFMLGKLQNRDMPEDISKLGDQSSLPSLFNNVQSFEIGTIFGGDFAARLSEMDPGEWAGPVQSDLGLHLVYVDKRVAGRLPELDEIESIVRDQWLSARRNAAIEDMYLRLAESYTISIE